MLPKKGLCVLDFFPCYFLFSLKHVTSWIIKITICLYWSFWEISQHNWSWWAIKDTICTCCLFMRVKYWWKCKSFKQMVFFSCFISFCLFFFCYRCFQVEVTLFSEIKMKWKACIAPSSRKHLRSIYHKKSKKGIWSSFWLLVLIVYVNT